MEKLIFRDDDKIAIGKHVVDIKNIQIIEINKGIVDKQTKNYLSLKTKHNVIDCFYSNEELKVIEIFLKLNHFLKNYNFRILNQRLINRDNLSGIKVYKYDGQETIQLDFYGSYYEIYSGYDQNLIDKIIATCNSILDDNKIKNDSNELV